MKSAYYAAIAANAYRMAIDKYLEDPEGYVYDERLLAELETVSHREYCTGYYFDEPSYENNTVTNMGYIREKAYLARVISYDKETKRAYLFQRNKMVNGQTAELVTPGKFGIPFTVRNMTDKYGNPIDSAPHPLMEFYIESDIEMHEGDLIRGAE
jgi:putative protease